MHRRLGLGLLVLSVALLLPAALVPTSAAAGMACESFTGFQLREAGTITVAQSIPAGTFTPPGGAPINNLPAFCRVAGVLTPTS